MKKVFFVGIVSLYSVMSVNCEIKTEANHIEHVDAIDSILNLSSQQAVAAKKNVPYYEDKEPDLILRCYKNGLCLIKDTRVVKAKAGKNKIVFDDIYQGLMFDTITYRTPRNGKININHYKFNRAKAHNQVEIFEAAINSEILFSLDDKSTEKGILKNIIKEKNSATAVIESDKKLYVIPVTQCLAIDSKNKSAVLDNTLDVDFNSVEEETFLIDINYLTKNIFWQSVCCIEVFESLDRVDVCTRALIHNKTEHDLSNINVTFDMSTPTVLQKEFSNICNKIDSAVANYRYNYTISVPRNSEVMCELHNDKCLKPKVEYKVCISDDILGKHLSQELDLDVNNVVVVKSEAAIGISSGDDSSVAYIFKRVGNERTFIGVKKVVDLVRGDSELACDVGVTSEISAKLLQTDYKSFSDKQFERGLRLIVKNNYNHYVTVVMCVDVKGNCSIVKSNFDIQDSQRLMWKIDFKPGELRELHFRLRENK